MAQGANMTVNKIRAALALKDNIVATPRVAWREERLWNISTFKQYTSPVLF
jgi:hypothetical protein